MGLARIMGGENRSAHPMSSAGFASFLVLVSFVNQEEFESVKMALFRFIGLDEVSFVCSG